MKATPRRRPLGFLLLALAVAGLAVAGLGACGGAAKPDEEDRGGGPGGTPGPGPGPGPGPTPSRSYATSLTNVPAGRANHSAVWTGTEMIVWGGITQVAFRDDGGAYDPVANAWRPISTLGAPAGRIGHSAVWTGTEMIVFGGWNNAPLNTGGAYDPATGTWRPLPTAGAPVARALHSAVWTGTRMIVWGGVGVFPPPAPNSVARVFGDGAAYDPATNTWTPIAVGGPVSRAHTGVWTGTEMITWGGQDSFALTISTMNAGGRYAPAGDAWTATPVATAPAARVGHTAVWAGGSGMIVWGGMTDSINRTATGGRYLPATNTWAATSLAGAPGPRSGHTAVWTGTRMIVFGGSLQGVGLVADGAAYDPASNAWTALPSHVNTAPRSGHTAVWTGRAMVVWGGYALPADAYHASGIVYEP